MNKSIDFCHFPHSLCNPAPYCNAAYLVIYETINDHINDDDIHVSTTDRSKLDSIETMWETLNNIDLSKYVTNETVSSIVEEEISKKNYIDSIPSYYATIQQLSTIIKGLATIDNIQETLNTNYYTKEEVSLLLNTIHTGNAVTDIKFDNGYLILTNHDGSILKTPITFANGNSSVTVTVYTRSENKPDAPTGGMYDFNLNRFIDSNLTYGWYQDGYLGDDEHPLWMSQNIFIGKKDITDNGVISSETPWSDPVRISGTNGVDGQPGLSPNTSYKSIVFKRDNLIPSTPTGGSYTDPIPEGWSDGIPEGEAALWASTRIFSSDGKAPQQSVWSTPKQMTDTSTLDVEFSSLENPTDPYGHPNANPDWSNESTSDTKWMATSECHNGVWSDWNVMHIKGEKGEDGTSVKIDGSAYGHFYTKEEYDNMFSTETDENIKYAYYLVDSYSDMNSVIVTTSNGDSTVTVVEVSKGIGYVTYLDGHLWMSDGQKWIDCGTFKGEQGEPGENGKTAFIHIKYATSTIENSWSENNGETPDKYLGMYTDYEIEDKLQWNLYTWRKFKGDDGFGYEYIYKRTKQYEAPVVPTTSVNEDEYCPTGWTDSPSGVDKEYQYEWTCYRKKVDGTWSNFIGSYIDTTKAALWAKFGLDGTSASKFFLDCDNDNVIADSMTISQFGNLANAKFTLSDSTSEVGTYKFESIIDTNLEGITIVTPETEYSDNREYQLQYTIDPSIQKLPIGSFVTTVNVYKRIGDTATIISTRKQKIIIKDFSQGSSYKLLVSPTQINVGSDRKFKETHEIIVQTQKISDKVYSPENGTKDNTKELWYIIYCNGDTADILNTNTLTQGTIAENYYLVNLYLKVEDQNILVDTTTISVVADGRDGDTVTVNIPIAYDSNATYLSTGTSGFIAKDIIALDGTREITNDDATNTVRTNADEALKNSLGSTNIKSGSGYLAKGNLYWNEDGDLNIKGNVRIEGNLNITNITSTFGADSITAEFKGRCPMNVSLATILHRYTNYGNSDFFTSFQETKSMSVQGWLYDGSTHSYGTRVINNATMYRILAEAETYEILFCAYQREIGRVFEHNSPNGWETDKTNIIQKYLESVYDSSKNPNPFVIDPMTSLYKSNYSTIDNLYSHITSTTEECIDLCNYRVPFASLIYNIVNIYSSIGNTEDKFTDVKIPMENYTLHSTDYKNQYVYTPIKLADPKEYLGKKIEINIQLNKDQAWMQLYYALIRYISRTVSKEQFNICMNWPDSSLNLIKDEYLNLFRVSGGSYKYVYLDQFKPSDKNILMTGIFIPFLKSVPQYRRIVSTNWLCQKDLILFNYILSGSNKNTEGLYFVHGYEDEVTDTSLKNKYIDNIDDNPDSTEYTYSTTNTPIAPAVANGSLKKFLQGGFVQLEAVAKKYVTSKPMYTNTSYTHTDSAVTIYYWDIISSNFSARAIESQAEDYILDDDGLSATFDIEEVEKLNKKYGTRSQEEMIDYIYSHYFYKGDDTLQFENWIYPSNGQIIENEELIPALRIALDSLDVKYKIQDGSLVYEAY